MFCIQWATANQVRVLNTLMKGWKTFTAEWTAEKITDPEGNEFLFAFGLSLWSWYTNIPAAMLWLLRSSANGSQFTFTALSKWLVSPLELPHSCFKEAFWKHKSPVHSNVSAAFINYVLEAQSTSIFPPSNEWKSLLFSCWYGSWQPFKSDRMGSFMILSCTLDRHRRKKGPALATLVILSVLLVSC